MRTTFLMIALAVSGVIFQSCDDDSNITIDPQIESVFISMYPEAQRVTWEHEGAYYVADFLLNSIACEAWFSNSAEWRMTESDITYEMLPQAVKTVFEAGEYANWRIDDIDMIERNTETVYVIEVEKGKYEVDLYYLPDGTLIKAIADSGNTSDYIPNDYLASIQEFIAAKYPGARILDTEKDDSMIEVDILDNDVHRELKFTFNGEWVCTKTEIRKSEVPESIMNILANSEYGSYKIDDIDFYETPTGNYYKFELELNNKDIDVIIDLNGNLKVKR
ncbi:MAG: PepSY-like domain-containing protein [Cytophagaceae bacterium]|jgi:uncharacterized membrane protein YkoI|nr:PepSY-like domain-containing protein [Cytophagaceae bacterium]